MYNLLLKSDLVPREPDDVDNTSRNSNLALWSPPSITHFPQVREIVEV